MKTKKHSFSKAQRIILSEVYRRLNYFHNGDLNTRLLLLAFPSQIVPIEKYDLLIPISPNRARCLNWYSLTEKGKDFFAHYAPRRLTSKENANLFTNHSILEFDYDLLESICQKS